MVRKAAPPKSNPLFAATSVTTILGSRGCGKTFLSRTIQKLYPRVIIIDVTGEYTDGVECHTFDEFCDALKESLKQEKFRIIFHSHMDAGDEERDHIDHIIRLTMIRSAAPEAKFNNVLLVCEEVQNYSNTHALPQYLKKCLLIGRHHGVACIFTSQRPGEVNKTILSQSHNVFAGTCAEPNDIKYLSQRLGPEAERLHTIPERKFLLHRIREPLKIVNNSLDSSESLVNIVKDRSQNNISEKENENPAL